MVNTTIFLGAGASKPFGIPTMKEMVTLFEAELRKNGSPEEINLYNEIKLTLTSEYGTEVDLEAVFTVIDSIVQDIKITNLGINGIYFIKNYLKSSKDALESAYSKVGTNYNTAKTLKNKFEDFVKVKCDISEGEHGHILNIYEHFFHNLATRTSANHTIGDFAYSDWKIFTTNYDLCIEYFFNAKEITLNTGFSYNPARNRIMLDTSSFASEHLTLLKLHGSISWLKLDDGSIVELRDMPIRPWDGRRIVGGLMLYPIQQKATYLEPYLDMFYQLQFELKRRKNWVVIGYSFNDEIIREMFLSNSEKGKKMLLLHPGANKVIDNKLSNIKCEVIPMENVFGDSRGSLYDSIGDVFKG